MFYDAIEITETVEVCGSYVADGSAAYTTALDLGAVSIDDLCGSYVADGSSVFSNSILLDDPSPDALVDLYTTEVVQKTIYPAESIFLTTLPMSVGDDSYAFVFGLLLDFIGAPRYGSAPLAVQFTNRSSGPIEAYYWLFGDESFSQESDPLHIYKVPGVYNVSLRVLVEGKWYQVIRRKFITVHAGGVIVSRTNKSYSLAVTPEQGIGFSENTGDEWVFPETGDGPLLIYDDNDQPHMLVLDNNDGFWYDMATRRGPGTTKAWKDKESTDGSGGTAVVPLVRFGEDTGTYEHYWIRHALSHIYIRPIDENDRNETGYDERGLPTGLELDLEIFVDGEPSTARRKTRNIPVTGDVHFDDVAEGNRLALQVTANMGAHMITGRKQDYIVSDRPTGDGVMTEGDYQDSYSLPVMWFSRGQLALNRATGATVDPLAVSAATGVDGRSDSAMQFIDEINLGAVSLSGGALLLWHKNIASVKIGNSTIALTAHDVSGAWTLSYASGITASGDVVITPSGTGCLFDGPRIYNNAVLTDAIGYYFDDITDNSGAVMLP